MCIMYQLLTPIVSKNIITRENYNELPAFLQPHISAYDHVWLVLVVPQAQTDPNTPCRVAITAAANNRTGAIGLNNNGRTPVSAPPVDFDDLRPISFYVWGVGSQTFRVRVTNNTSVYTEARVDFE